MGKKIIKKKILTHQHPDALCLQSHSNVKLQLAATFCVSNLIWNEDNGKRQTVLLGIEGSTGGLRESSVRDVMLDGEKKICFHNKSLSTSCICWQNRADATRLYQLHILCCVYAHVGTFFFSPFNTRGLSYHKWGLEGWCCVCMRTSSLKEPTSVLSKHPSRQKINRLFWIHAFILKGDFICFSATSVPQTFMVLTVTPHWKPVTLKPPKAFIVVECSNKKKLPSPCSIKSCHFVYASGRVLFSSSDWTTRPLVAMFLSTSSTLRTHRV